MPDPYDYDSWDDWLIADYITDGGLLGVFKPLDDDEDDDSDSDDNDDDD